MKNHSAVSLWRRVAVSFSLLFTLSAVPVNAGVMIDPELIPFGRGETDLQSVYVIVAMSAPANEPSPPTRYDQTAVLEFLRARLYYSWNTVAGHLYQSGHLDYTIRPVASHWINNTFTAEVSPDGLRALAKTPGVAKIYYNRDVIEEPTINGQDPWDEADPELAGMPYDFPEMGLDRLIKEMPQITGKGVVVGSIDTGVDGNHPALAGKVISFFDARSGQLTEPYDRGDHGTHTAGTIVGGDRSRTLVGVAPDAKLVASAALSSYDHMLRAMEFMLDPDSDPSTVDMPRAVNNSWNCEGAPDVELFYKAISAWEAAGVLPVFSAGNAGRRGLRSITRPHEHPSVLAVGATGPDGKIAPFSSRGPGSFRGQDTQKPDLTAPGVDIDSTMPGGGFGKMSGTSMAAPHVTGAVALLLQIDPMLNPAQLKELLMATATPMSAEDDFGDGTWNPHYGMGKTDIYRAAKAANEIRRRRSGGIGDLMSTILTSPREIILSKFLGKAPVLDLDELAYSTSQKGDGGPDWSTAEDLEKK